MQRTIGIVTTLIVLLGLALWAQSEKSLYQTREIGTFDPVVVPGGDAVHTELMSLYLGCDYKIGDLIFVDAFAILDKADIDGDTILLIRSKVPMQVLFAGTTVDLEDRRFVPAGGRIQTWLHGIGRVAKRGCIELVMKASSAGSDSTRYASQMRTYKFAW